MLKTDRFSVEEKIGGVWLRDVGARHTGTQVIMISYKHHHYHRLHSHVHEHENADYPPIKTGKFFWPLVASVTRQTNQLK